MLDRLGGGMLVAESGVSSAALLCYGKDKEGDGEWE